jgi:hypothetical protein
MNRIGDFFLICDTITHQFISHPVMPFCLSISSTVCHHYRVKNEFGLSLMLILLFATPHFTNSQDIATSGDYPTAP